MFIQSHPGMGPSPTTKPTHNILPLLPSLSSPPLTVYFWQVHNAMDALALLEAKEIPRRMTREAKDEHFCAIEKAGEVLAKARAVHRSACLQVCHVYIFIYIHMP